ncbi:hypothetical protein [Maribacter sp. R77961]|uniref:hypothetical protein n=1 Tax=Maribacter sp. R77961 TaxID=3093871 RepID=UPI0037C8D97E
MNRNEKYELDFQRFVNRYKGISINEIITSIQSKSNYEPNDLLFMEVIKDGNIENRSVGHLVRAEKIILGLITYSNQDDGLMEILKKIQLGLKK